MKDETKKKWKEVGKIVYGIVVGGFAAFGVISLVGMIKSCSQGETTPVVTTPVISTIPKKAVSVSTNIQRESPFGQATKWAQFQLSTSYRGIGDNSQDASDITCFAVRYKGGYYQIEDVHIELSANDSYTSNLYYYVNDYEFLIAEVELDNKDQSVNWATWYCDGFYTLNQFVGNYPASDQKLLDSLTHNGLLSPSTPIGEFDNPVYNPHSTWPVSYVNKGGYWVDNVTGGIVTQMTNGQVYNLVWVSVQGYLYPSDIQVEEHTSTNGGSGIFSSNDGRVHMEFTAADPIGDHIKITTDLSSLAIPNGTNSGDDQVNTAEGIGNSFALLGSAFSAMAGLLSMQVFPGLSLSALLFVPVVVAVILFIIKAIQK